MRLRRPLGDGRWQGHRLALLKKRPRISKSLTAKILAEGHTDDRGSDVANLDLSRRRAASVVAFLVKAGVDASRMGRAANRRVDFNIIEFDGKPVSQSKRVDASPR